MVPDPEQLPTWLAWPFVRLSPDEPPASDAQVCDAADALFQHAAIVLLAQALSGSEQVGLALERELRTNLASEMRVASWIGLLDTLLTLRPDLDAAEGTRALREAIAQRSAADAATRLTAESLWQLLADNPWIRTPLCHVRGVQPTGDGDFRALRGTAWPRVRTAQRVPWTRDASGLHLWNRTEAPIPVPRWLVTFDEPRGVARYYAGRDFASRQWRYASRNPGAEDLLVTTIAEDAPVFVAEPTWLTPGPVPGRSRTPAPAPGRPAWRAEETAHGNSMIAAFHDLRRAEASGEILEWAKRASVPDRQLVLMVVSGRELLRFVDLPSGAAVVIGRKPAAPQATSFVIHHKRMSRTHARVWRTTRAEVFLQDLASVNGCFVNGDIVGLEPTAIQEGDLMLVGGTLLRLQWLSNDERRKLERLAQLAEDPERDRLTGLQPPTFLTATLDRRLSDAKVPTGDCWGILVTLERIGALHQQRGAETADVAFRSVARNVLAFSPDPELCVRVGYGEILVVTPHGGAQAVQVREELRQRMDRQIWDPSSRLQVHVRFDLAPRDGQGNEAWIQNLRDLATADPG